MKCLLKPSFEVERGARPPRALFSAPSRKTFAVRKSSDPSARSRARKRDARRVPRHPRAGVLPSFRVSFETVNFRCPQQWAKQKMQAKHSTTKGRHDGIGIPSAIRPFAVVKETKNKERTNNENQINRDSVDRLLRTGGSECRWPAQYLSSTQESVAELGSKCDVLSHGQRDSADELSVALGRYGHCGGDR